MIILIQFEMLYIITALKPEAQAFVDRFRLAKKKCDNFTVYIGKDITVIISGIGVNNIKMAIKKLLENYPVNEDDIFLNVGICGAKKEYKIGELLEISSIIYQSEKYVLNKNSTLTITCTDEEMSVEMYDIVDMESFGFYEATKDMKNRYMYKVVSDHFEPESVTKEKCKSLIFENIKHIMQKVENAKER